MATSVAAAQQGSPPTATRSLAAVRVDAPPVIDGRLSDPAWTAAPVASRFVQNRPNSGASSTQETEVRVLYDDEALYVGVRNHDTRPDSVVARLARRDAEVYSDWFTVMVDSYHDRRTAFAFAVNPRGVKRDYVLANDTEEDAGWDAVWEAATATDADGWTAEFRIPLSQLRFRGGRGERVWGINFARLVARRDELAYWSPVPGEAAGLVSRFGELAGLRGLPSPRRLELAPYTVVRATRAPGEAADPFHRPTVLEGSIGADLKYGVTSNLTVSATLNPDFGQVEADPSEVNLTANESFFEEKRPFFTEGADLFGIGFPNLFYSRRIGARPRGRLSVSADFADVPPWTTVLGAAKLTGKTASGWSIGVLDAVTARESARWADLEGGRTGRQDVEPLTNYLAARMLRDFRRGGSAVGAIVTSVTRLTSPELTPPRPLQANVAGVDARHRFGRGNFEVHAAAMVSRVAGSAESIALVQQSPIHSFRRPDADHLRFDSTRTSLEGYGLRGGLRKVGGAWRWHVGGVVLSPGFDANDLGFLPWVDRARQWVDMEYQQLRPGPLFRSWRLEAGEAGAWTFGGERNDLNARIGGRFQLHNYWGGQASVFRYASALSPNALRGGSALRESAGTGGSFSLHTDTRRVARAMLSANATLEDEMGGSFLRLTPRASVRPSLSAEISVAPSLQWNRSPAQYVGGFRRPGGTEYVVGRLDQTTTSVTLRLDYTFAPALSLQLYAEPFLSAGRFSDFRTVQNAGALQFEERYRTLGRAEISSGAKPGEGRIEHRVDLNGDGASDLVFGDPSFSVKHFNSNAVLRWEYRPGSTLSLVWGQGRDNVTSDGHFDLRRNTADLFRARASNVLLIKASYWLGM